jgi:hypothetical protein
MSPSPRSATPRSRAGREARGAPHARACAQGRAQPARQTAPHPDLESSTCGRDCRLIVAYSRTRADWAPNGLRCPEPPESQTNAPHRRASSTMVDDGRYPCTHAESAAPARRGGITPYQQEVAGWSPAPPIVTKHDAEPFADAGRGCRKPLWWASSSRGQALCSAYPRATPPASGRALDRTHRLPRGGVAIASTRIGIR